MVTISPENSAQGTTSKPNPFVEKALDRLIATKPVLDGRTMRLADLGCGRLRHLRVLLCYSNDILLVDTKKQIERIQVYAGTKCSMMEYVKPIDASQRHLRIETIDIFEQQENELDVVLSIAVFDVVLKKERIRMIRAAYRNLHTGGYLVVIVPRNNSSMLEYCTSENRLQDGYISRNRGNGPYTFYTNYRDIAPLVGLLSNEGFAVIEDLSVFRNVCLIAQRI